MTTWYSLAALLIWVTSEKWARWGAQAELLSLTGHPVYTPGLDTPPPYTQTISTGHQWSTVTSVNIIISLIHADIEQSRSRDVQGEEKVSRAVLWADRLCCFWENSWWDQSDVSEVCLHHCFSCVGAMRHRGESVEQISTSEISNQNFTFYANAVQAWAKKVFSTYRMHLPLQL